jgi:hypothetical protein
MFNELSVSSYFLTLNLYNLIDFIVDSFSIHLLLIILLVTNNYELQEVLSSSSKVLSQEKEKQKRLTLGIAWPINSADAMVRIDFNN